MIVKYSKDDIMKHVNKGVIGWSFLYEALGIMDLPWGDVKPDVMYLFMSHKDQVELMSLWGEMIKKTKNKRFTIYREKYRKTILGMEDLCYHPCYAGDLDCYFMVDTETFASHLKDFNIKLECKKG